jgi:hypothetical protein
MGVVCLGMLLSVHHHAYDLVLLVAPVIAVIVGALPTELLDARRRVVLLGLFGLLGVNYVTTLSVLHRLENQGLLWVVLASLNGAALLTAFLIYVAPPAKRTSAGITPSSDHRFVGTQRRG